MTKVKTKTSGLGDTELVLLAGACKRADRLIEPPVSMKPATRQRAGANLIKRGLAEERDAGRNEPVWREDGGGRWALRATPAGLAAVGIEEVGEGTSAPSEPAQPKEGSRAALLVGMLSRPAGAGIDELMAATGWLPHTTRAALTGLRKRGYEVGRERDPDGQSRYRIALAALERPLRPAAAASLGRPRSGRRRDDGQCW